MIKRRKDVSFSNFRRFSVPIVNRIVFLENAYQDLSRVNLTQKKDKNKKRVYRKGKKNKQKRKDN